MALETLCLSFVCDEQKKGCHGSITIKTMSENLGFNNHDRHCIDLSSPLENQGWSFNGKGNVCPNCQPKKKK